MRIYIYGLIIFFAFILMSHLLSIKEGLTCLDSGTITDFNLNSNNIQSYEQQVNDFINQVSQAEQDMQQNIKIMGQNMQHNIDIKNAVCPDECPDIPSGVGNAPEKHVCDLGCCKFTVHFIRNSCDTPWNSSKSDADSKLNRKRFRLFPPHLLKRWEEAKVHPLHRRRRGFNILIIYNEKVCLSFNYNPIEYFHI